MGLQNGLNRQCLCLSIPPKPILLMVTPSEAQGKCGLDCRLIWHSNCSIISVSSAFLAERVRENPETSFSSSGWVFGVAPSLLSFWAGGPEIFTRREIAKLALEAQGKPVKISTSPLWLAGAAVGLTKVFSRHNGELLAFFTTMMITDVVAPVTGTHALKAFYREYAQRETG